MRQSAQRFSKSEQENTAGTAIAGPSRAPSFADKRPAAAIQRKLAERAHDSTQAGRHLAMSEHIHQGSRMVALRKRHAEPEQAASRGEQAPPATLQRVVQRAPAGTYANTTPALSGIFRDTSKDATHNSVKVPERRVAVMRQPADGGVPCVVPPGWLWLKNKIGRLKGQWVRFHIINGKLGGLGSDTSNLVPTTAGINTGAAWTGMEREAKDSAHQAGRWTYVDVKLNYDNKYPDGIPKSISGECGYWDRKHGWKVLNRTGTLHQGNPKDTVGDNNFVYASSCTQDVLRRAAIPKYRWETAGKLLTAVYRTQTEFDATWSNAFADYDEGWETFLERLVVDEDDTGGILIRTS